MYIPKKLFRDKTLVQVVVDYMDPYNSMVWNDLYPIIKNEPEVIKILVENNYDKKEYSEDLIL